MRPAGLEDAAVGVPGRLRRPVAQVDAERARVARRQGDALAVGVAGVEEHVAGREAVEAQPEAERYAARLGEIQRPGQLGVFPIGDLQQQAGLRDLLGRALAPEALEEGRVDLVDASHGLLGLGDPGAAVLLDEVGVAHADGGVVVVEENLGLRPVDGAAALDAAREPHGIAVAEVPPAVVVEPEQVLPVPALPQLGAGPGVLEPSAAWGAGHVDRLRPGVALVAAARDARVARGGAIDAVEGAVAQDDEVVLLLDGAELGRANAVLAVGQQLPAELGDVGLGEDVGRVVEPALAVVEHVLAELGEGEVDAPVVGERLADAPEDLHLALPLVRPVAGRDAHGQAIALGRPRPPAVVGVAIAVPAEHVDADLLPVQGPHVVAVVVVEGVDAAVGHNERDDPRCLRPRGRLDVGERRPRPALVGADGRDHVLSALAFVAAACGEGAEPVALLRDHDVGLVAVVLVGDAAAGLDVAGIVAQGSDLPSALCSGVDSPLPSGCGQSGQGKRRDGLEDDASRTLERHVASPAAPSGHRAGRPTF